MFSVCTTFSNRQLSWAMNSVASFKEFWPEDVNLYVYLEGDHNDLVKAGNIYWLNFDTECPEHINFLNIAHNHKENNFYKAATRFSYKAFTIISFLENPHSKYAIWMDADTVTDSSITQEWLKNLVDSECYISILMRRWLYVESGFIIFDTQHPYHNEFVNTLKKLYLSGNIFKEDQWHDAYLITQIILRAEKEKKIKIKDLSPPHKTMHPFVEGILGEKMDHLKGYRKATGFSKERSKKKVNLAKKFKNNHEHNIL